MMKLYIEDLRVQNTDVSKNLATMKQHITDAVEKQYDVILFPQLSLSGLHCNDKFHSDYFLKDIEVAHNDLKGLSKSIQIVFGSLLKDGDDLYNVIYSYRDGKETQSPIIKDILSHYETEYFSSRQSDKKLLLGDNTYSVVFDSKGSQEDDVVFALDIFDKNEVSCNANIYINPLAVSNMNDHVYIYPGGSRASKASESSKMSKLYDAMIFGIKAFDEEVLPFNPNWIVGVSGGLDSSLTVTLLSLALGADRVIGVNMPSEYSSVRTQDNASHLADTLGYKSYVIPIKTMTDGTQEAFAGAGFDQIKGLAYENVQARLRGHTLMTLSSIENGIISNNGNKIETALGYATLYGDAIGVIGLLADLNKLEVGALSSYINELHNKEIIPNNLIPTIHDNLIEWDFAPSAELASNQVDPMKWGYHDSLVEYLLSNPVEDLLASYLDGTVFKTQMGLYMNAYGLDKPELFIDDLEWVLRTMNTAKYKRVQTPPILTLSHNSFGNESQGSIIKSETYNKLVKEILKK